MSVDRITYLMWAVDLDVDYDGEQFIGEIEGHDNRRFDLVDDGMCGEYTLFGHIISTLGEGDGYAERETFSPTKVTFIDMGGLAERISEATGKDVKAEDFQLIHFNHFF